MCIRDRLTISRPTIAIFPIFLQRSIVYRNAYKVTENRLSMSENDVTAEGQTCGIARFTTLIVRKTMFDLLNVYKMTENRWSKSENAATEEGQTCGIARFPHLSKKSISTPASLRTSKRLQIDPLLLLMLNRKPGSGNWLHMFSLYFCFRFSR